MKNAATLKSSAPKKALSPACPSWDELANAKKTTASKKKRQQLETIAAASAMQT
jgi:hypothetical protein